MFRKVLEQFKERFDKHPRVADQARPVSFVLLFEHRPVGELSFAHNAWKFRYSDEFQRNPDLRLLVEFPQLDKEYSSHELWPFFELRIPSLKQENLRSILADESIDESDQVQLLRRFGRRTISNPFELVEREAA